MTWTPARKRWREPPECDICGRETYNRIDHAHNCKHAHATDIPVRNV